MVTMQLNHFSENLILACVAWFLAFHINLLVVKGKSSVIAVHEAYDLIILQSNLVTSSFEMSPASN